MGIKYSLHARRRLAARNISEAVIEAVIVQPDWETTDPSDLQLTRAFKWISNTDQVLRVVYRRLADGDVLIVTAFPDRKAERS
jgi:Domain of unknown function (DUF4258)